MILTVKNKYIAAMEDLIESCTKKNGVPNEFQLSKTEYALFLKDVWMVPEMVNMHVSVEVKNTGDTFSLTNKIKAKNPQEDQVLKELVDKWVKNEYNILYKNIPVVYKSEEKAETPDTKETPVQKGW